MNAISNKYQHLPEIQPPNTNFNWSLLIIFIFGLILLVVAHWKGVDFLEKDDEGKPILSKERKQKLDNALRELEEAEQYALLATRNGFYPCFSCKDSVDIFLYLGEVWKYGTTTKGEIGRYRKTLSSQNLAYFVQYRGDLTSCKKEELSKIYNYAKLPENLKRDHPLIRPPGNKIDQ